MAEHRPNQRATGPGPSLAPDIERDALIAVDLQNDFCPGGALAVPRGDEVVPLANRLMTRYRQVVLTQDWHPPGHHSFARGHPGARIDFWGVGTRLFTGHGEPALSGVYKLAALEEGVAWRPRLKVAERATKTTLPGRKQVWRLRGQEGWWEGDVIAQADEAITPAVGEITGYHPLFEHESKRYGSIASAEPLLEPVLLGGEPVGELPSPAAARERARSQLERLHPTSRRLLNPHTYKVSVSERTLELRRRLREAHERGIGDETYEIVLGYRRAPGRKRAPFVMIYDFVGFDAMSRHPLEQIGVHLWNRTWAGKGSGKVGYIDLGLFIGEEEDVPDVRFGPFLPSRRAWARARCRFVGYVLDFDPTRRADVSAARRELGYGPGPLVVCAVGGTAIGRELLELCGAAFPILQRAMPEVQMILVGGPRLDRSGLRVPPGVSVVGYVPALHRHLAACDLAVVQGGGTVTLELTALRRPFIFFPIEGHCEQEVHVAGRLARHRAGIGLRQSATDPAGLAEVMRDALASPAQWGAIPVQGARLAAEAIRGLL